MMNGEPRIERDQLRDLLNQRAKALCDDVVQAKGQISEERLERLERLARLVEISAVATPPPPRVRWRIVALLGVTLVIISILLFARVSKTEIELDLSLSEVSFGLPQQQVLTDVMKLSDLGVSGLQEIQLPRSETQDARAFRASDGPGFAIRLSTGSEGKQKGTVTLAALPLPAGAHVWLRPTEIPQQFRLSIKGAELILRADVDGPVGIGLPDTPPQRLKFSSPKSILMRSGSNDIDLDIKLSAASKSIFSPQLFVTDLSFFRVDQLLEPERTIVRRVSTILSGALYFEELSSKERRLRSGEAIRFESSKGEIRTLQLHDDHMTIAFHGQVSDMTTGAGTSRSSLMPTYLEWLRARHSLSLLWGTTLYVFGLIVGVLRWWSNPK
jgi:hypothetical protein